jgi:hypothetical protein
MLERQRVPAKPRIRITASFQHCVQIISEDMMKGKQCQEVRLASKSQKVVWVQLISLRLVVGLLCRS